MNHQIQYYVYASKINLTQIFDHNLFTDIREQAQSNNQHHHITGFLLFKDGKFLQYIEGQKAVCEQLFNTIKQDRRHKEIVVLDQGQLEKRYYQQWLMNCYNMDEKTQTLELLNLPDMVYDFDIYHWSQAHVHEVMSLMAKNHLLGITPQTGSFFSVVYRRFMGQNKKYLIIQLLILGMFFISLLFLKSNH